MNFNWTGRQYPHVSLNVPNVKRKRMTAETWAIIIGTAVSIIIWGAAVICLALPEA